MKKIDHATINRSNLDIWETLKMALDTGNNAVIESTLLRLHKLQKYYIDLITFQEIEINQLKDLLAQESSIRNSFEREWIESIAKKSHNYEELKQRIKDTYKKI